MTAQHSQQGGGDRSGPVIIAIVGFRNAEDIRQCLSALAKLEEINFVVSICENGGHESYLVLKRVLEGLVAFESTDVPIKDDRVGMTAAGRLQPNGQRVSLFGATANLGYAGGINVSLAQLEPDQAWSAMWILNPDTQPHPNALSALVARARDGYDLISSRLVFAASGRVQSYGGYWRRWIARGLNLGMNAPGDAKPDIAEIEHRMNYVSGASLFATRDMIKRIGPFDERYFLYCEEIDWCLRRGSARIGYAHDAIVQHAHGSTIGSNVSRKTRSALSVYLDERNRLLLTRRFFPFRYPLVLISTLLLTLQYLRAGAFRNFHVALAGWWAGVCGEEGLPQRFLTNEAGS